MVLEDLWAVSLLTPHAPYSQSALSGSQELSAEGAEGPGGDGLGAI